MSMPSKVSKIEWGTIVTLLLAIVSGAVWLGSLSQRVSGLENYVQELRQDLKSIRDSGSSRSRENPSIPEERVSELNIDETETNSNLRLPSSIQVKWNEPSNMQVQVYKNGNPTPIYDRQHSSGVVLKLEPGQYEIKLWKPGARVQYKNVWIEVTE